jgi:spermidine-citrate ligase
MTATVPSRPPTSDTWPGASPAAATTDPFAAATAAASEALLNCYLRETSGWRFAGPDVGSTDLGPAAAAQTLVVPLPSRGGVDVVVGVRYRSATFRHRYVWPARLVLPGQAGGSPLTFTALASLLLDELPAGAAEGMTTAPTELLLRMLDSLHAVAGHLRERGHEVDRLWSADPLPFVESEQALLLGHPVHPTPKSRTPMSPRERQRFSPETQARFPLHWLAVRSELVHHASATGTSAPELVETMLRHDPATDTALLDTRLEQLDGSGTGRMLLPAHPWELDFLRSQPDVVDLFDSGAVVDLGPFGSPVTPTTSVRTVYQAEWPWQLKFSLHVRVTNSQRVTLPKELDRAVEAAHLAQTVVGADAARIAPGFRFVHDPAYLTLQCDGRVVDGFSVLLRENPWPGGSTGNGVENVSAVTTLCQDHPFGGLSRLGAIVHRLAAADGTSPTGTGRAWFGRFCDVAVVSLVRLYLELGLCFEAHQQNTLLELDASGWPVRCAYRDSQGYFHREAAHDDLCQVIPGLGEASESIFPEALADERLVYYPFLNLTLGVVNALGAAGCDESVLLGDLRRCLDAERSRPTRYPATLLDRLLDDPRWPCKGNLRTRWHDMDELVGDISTQSVYVSVPNPLSGLV